MPQWDFLDFLASQAARYPTFMLRMNAEVTGLIEESGHIVGLQAATPEGTLNVHARLVVGADGRHSVVRERAGLQGTEFGAPMDVLWFRLSRRPDDPEDPVGRFDRGKVLVMLNRDKYWQCGFVIPKGSHAQVRERGLAVLRHSIAELAPFIADRVGELQDWEVIKLLTVQVDRLDQWYRQGLICIGDAAHAMSPLGGVGINLAIQDAVATSNLLAAPFREDRLTIGDLHQVQQRRAWPTQMTQRLQVFLQNRVISRVLHGTGPLSPPFFLRLLAHFPFLRAIPARLIGIGFRPEHVNTRSERAE
jgi:2-polyprenyl-6-methoxyphenol hydroxylase-like FAD-dependent oxidoreductase